MGRGLVLALLSLALLGGAAAPALSAPADAMPAGSVAYADTTGEAAVAPDLTSVTVSADGAGQLSFHVVAAGFPRQPLTGDQSEEVFLCLDTDRNIDTGSSGGGCDYEFWVYKDPVVGQQLWFGSYATGTRKSFQSPADMTLTGTGDDFVVTLPEAKIGSPASFDFYAYSNRENAYSGPAAAIDWAPDHGWWTFPSTPPAGRVAHASTSGVPFVDPTGDGRGAIDVSNVVLSDASSARVTFATSVSGLSAGGDIQFFVDADRNPATGEDGRDYIVSLFKDPTFGWVDTVDRWNGASWSFEDAGLAGATAVGPVLNISATIPRYDLGGSNGLDFYALAQNYNSDGSVLDRDDAPDTQWWTYTPAQLTAPELAKPVFGKPHLVGKVVAGRTVTITYPVKRSDNGKPFRVAGVLGDGPTIGKTFLPERVKVGAGFVRWTIAIPKSRKGQWLQLQFGAFDAYQAAFTAKSFRIR